MDENKVSYGIKIEDGVVDIDVTAKIDLIEVLSEMAKNTSNSVDDYLVKMLDLASKNLDWKGYAKEHIID